jgi:hypothetical protein
METSNIRSRLIALPSRCQHSQALGRVSIIGACLPRNFPGSGVVVSPNHHQDDEMKAAVRIAATKAELNRYFDMINRRVPGRVAQSIKWLRKPSSFAVRLLVAIALILGGIFSVLPLLGLWMLPLGLLLISQDLPFLQKPLVTALAWMETKWKMLRLKWQKK